MDAVWSFVAMAIVIVVFDFHSKLLLYSEAREAALGDEGEAGLGLVDKVMVLGYTYINQQQLLTFIPEKKKKRRRLPCRRVFLCI